MNQFENQICRSSIKYFVLFFATFINSLFALGIEIKGNVYDKNSKPLGYCYVFLKSSGIGVVSQEDGSFRIRIDNNEDTLVFKMLGYLEKKIHIKSVNTEKYLDVFLDSDPIRLNELVISRKRNLKTTVIGNLENNSNNYYILNLGSEMAVKFEAPVTHSILSEISLRFNNILNNQLIPVRIKVYECDSLTGMPSRLILNENVVLKKKVRNKWISIDLAPYSVFLNSRCFFVSFETFEWSSPTYHFGQKMMLNSGLLFNFTKSTQQTVFFKNLSASGYYYWSQLNNISPLIRATLKVD